MASDHILCCQVDLLRYSSWKVSGRLVVPTCHGNRKHGDAIINFSWLVVSIPLKNDGVRQLGSWNSQYMESHKIPWFQTTNQSLFRTAKVVEKSVKHLETPPCPRPHLHSFPGRPKLNGPLRVLSRDKWGLAIQHQGHVVSGRVYRLPSGKHTKSYWKWPFIVDFPITNCDFPVCYVSLPEGNYIYGRSYASSCECLSVRVVKDLSQSWIFWVCLKVGISPRLAIWISG